jgi:hypothetical protein
MKKAWAFFALLAVCVLPAAAQSNSILDQMLESTRLSYGQAAYLALTASQRIPDSAETSQAAEALSGTGWKVRPRGADDPVTLGEYSFLLMRAFELKGGLFYRMIPGPRYAARELAYLRFIRGSGSPYRTLSGEEALGVLQRLLDWKESRS